ncbi:hypothetical protein CR513_13459, partial [Mucuna pruriens]
MAVSVIIANYWVERKKRRLGEEKKKNGFIREVKYPNWLSNVVIVKKPSDKWRMCIDYMDLNRACLKDPYPLPSIDALVDRASSCGILSFMDAYSSYYQIRMHSNDESKTTFIMDKGKFCYKVLSFGLMNVGATYQRLMDQIFKDHIGNQLEVYVDDMVVMSRMEVGMLKTWRQFSRRGIEANPEKCNAVIDMRSPKSVKEVQ